MPCVNNNLVIRTSLLKLHNKKRNTFANCMKTSILLLFVVLTSTFAFGKVDYLRVMFNHNGDYRATIGWNQVSGDSAIVFWGTEDIPPSRYLEYSHIARVTSQNDYKGMHNCFVRFINLKPNKAYYFVIKDNEGISERYWFKTTPNDENNQTIYCCWRRFKN